LSAFAPKPKRISKQSFFTSPKIIQARRWYDEIYDLCGCIGEMPRMGTARPEVRPDLRTFPMGNYLILYREIRVGAEIVRVIHGARQWQELL
jgi:toxin ParE1/3/4